MLEPLLSPGTVAVIGASRNPAKIGHAILNNLVRGGFQGTIVPVNSSADRVQGLESFRSLKDYPGTVDLAVITVPAPMVEAAVEESIDSGAQAVVVVSAGFKEIGPEGAEREERLKKLCQDGRVHLLGPRSLGVINTCHRLNASFAKHMPKECGISVLSESGAVCTAILDLAAAKHLGLSKVVAIGNKAGLNEIDFFRLFAEDDETNVVVVYLESISSGNEFIKAAEQLAAAKPMVILRAGTTGAGARAARSHTGSVPGEDIAYAAAFKRAGVVQAESIEALFDYAAALAMQPLPRGDRVAIVSNAGGPCVVAADALEHVGLRVAELKAATTASLRDKLPLPACIQNPIDVLGDADPDRFALAVQAAQEDESVDAILMIMTPHAMTRPAETARAAAQYIQGEKPMLAVFLGSADAMPGREDMVASGLPDYPSPERAVKALWAMREYAAWRERPPRVVTRFPVNRRRVERLIARQRRTGRLEVGEVRAKEILRAYDFTVPEGMLALDADAATDASERIGYPVAMKIVSPDIIHKSDAGGVKLHLSDAEQVLDAYDLLTLRFARHAPDARLEGIYVEKMCPRGLEVVIGMRRDPQFGPILLFGLGGIFVEALKDEAGYLAPITAEEAMQMLSGTRSYELLAGARGQPGADTTAIARGLQRISQLATDFPEIAELEINPFTVTTVGGEPIVVDARMVLSGVDR
jgi:acetyl coenzyme A synthetase (ADP forming)-like protein